MNEDQRSLRHLILRLDDTRIDVLISQLDSNIFPPGAFLDSDDNRDGDLDVSAERGIAAVNGVTWVAAWFIRCICAGFQ